MTDVYDNQPAHVKYIQICEKDDWCICEIVPDDFDLQTFDTKTLGTNISITPINSDSISVKSMKAKSINFDSQRKKMEQTDVVNSFRTEVRRDADVKSRIPKWQSEPERKYTDIHKLGKGKINIIDKNTEDETSVRNVFTKR